MAKFIKKIHDVVADLEGKNIATKHPPERVDRLLNMYIVDLFNGYLDQYVKTQKISNYLLAFKKQAELTVPNGGIVALPGDFAHWRELYTADGKSIDIVEDKFWDGRRNRKKAPPTINNPIARIENQNNVFVLEVYPRVTPVKLLYFKHPADARYAYTKTDNRYVYDDANSVDIEFPLGLYPDIVKRLLGGLGIVLREGQITQITEVLKTQDQLK